MNYLFPSTAPGAKFSPPNLESPRLARPRLHERLASVYEKNYRMTLVSAPAGYGKTTLLASWLADAPAAQPLACAWLNLEPEDNDPARLYTGLAAALGRLWPDVAQALEDIRRIHPSPPVESVAAALVDAIAAHKAPLALVVDDAHLLESGPALALFSLLLDFSPENFRLFWLARADPPLPLARLRVRDQLVEIRSPDLRFTPEESVRLFNELYPFDLQVPVAQNLQRVTSGWPAGLEGLAHAWQAQNGLFGAQPADPKIDFITWLAQPAPSTALAGGELTLRDFIFQEVFAGLDAESRELLLVSSLCSRLNASLSAALTAGEAAGPANTASPAKTAGAQAALDRLAAANLFIQPYGARRTWFECHSLYVPLLRQKLYAETQPEALAGLHRRAAAWYAAKGFPDEAIRHTLESRDYEAAAELIVAQADEQNRRGEIITLARWLERLPEQTLLERPSLGLQQAWAHYRLGRVEKIPGMLALLDKRVETGPLADPDMIHLRAEIANLRAAVSLTQGQLDGAAVSFAQALGRLPQDEHTLRASSNLGLGETRLLQGDLSGARAALRSAASAGQISGDISSVQTAYIRLEFIARMQGRLINAANIIDDLENALTSAGLQNAPHAGHALLGRGRLAREWNDLARAEGLLVQAASLGQRGGDARLQLDALIQLAFTRQALERPQAAAAAMEAAQKLAYRQPPNGWGTPSAEAHAAHLALMQGDLPSASAWARRMPRAVGERPDFSQEGDALVLARIWIAEGEIALARDLIDRLEITAGSGERYGRVLQAQILMALACLARGETEPALREISAALRRAEPQGYVRLFIDEGQPMAQLLYRAAEEGLSPEYAGHLLGAFDPGAPPVAVRPPGTAPLNPRLLIEPLTEREIEIVGLIAADLSNAEIAERLHITPGTVKVHSSNIYAKLGVHRRSDAIARARQIGVIR